MKWGPNSIQGQVLRLRQALIEKKIRELNKQVEKPTTDETKKDE